MVFDNILLDRETADIYLHDYPEHNSKVSMIIHTDDRDLYPEVIIGADFTTDYDGSLTDDITTSVMLGLGDYRGLIHPSRDRLMITLIQDFNGKKIKKLYKAILLTNHNVNSVRNNGYSDEFRNKTDMMEVVFQCINPVYSALKQLTVNGVVNNSNLETIIRHYMSREMAKITIDGEVVTPILDITPVHNTRVYTNVVIDDRVTLLDLPLFLQTRYGLYNGGVGTYVHVVDDKHVISIFPLYNSEYVNDRYRMTLYLPDIPMHADVNNKTVLLNDDELRVIGTSTSKRIDTGEVSDFDIGSGLKSVNSGQVMNRTYSKKNGVVYADRDVMIDTQVEESSKALLATAKYNMNTDNLYAMRSMYIRNRAKMLSVQWNFSRPDYLVSGMGVEVVQVFKGKVIREKGILVSSHHNIDNTTNNCVTMLNILIN